MKCVFTCDRPRAMIPPGELGLLALGLAGWMASGAGGRYRRVTFLGYCYCYRSLPWLNETTKCYMTHKSQIPPPPKSLRPFISVYLLPIVRPMVNGMLWLLIGTPWRKGLPSFPCLLVGLPFFDLFQHDSGRYPPDRPISCGLARWFEFIHECLGNLYLVLKPP